MPNKPGEISEVPALPTIHRKEPMDFDTWLNIVEQNGTKYLHPNAARQFYDEGWDAHEAIEMILDYRLYRTRPKPQPPKVIKVYQKAIYDVNYANKRLAGALLKECSLLLAKNLTPEGRKLVKDTFEQVQKSLFRT